MEESILANPADARTITGASGKVYTRSESLTPRRYREMQRLQIEYGFGASFQELVESDNRLYQALNSTQFVPAAYELMQRREGIVLINQKRLYASDLVALWYNTEGENLALFDPEQHKEKILDLETGTIEGRWIDIRFFLILAGKLIPGFTDAYEAYSQAILQNPPLEADDTNP